MIFLNALLVAGTLAASIPLIIHLLNRTRFRVLDWGAMHLLESALKINSRRIQWQAWLLLAMRMMIPAILALCLARPVLTAWRTAAGGNQHSVVLVIDNSLSMDAEAAAGKARSSDGASCLQSAIAQATALLERFGPATEVTVLSAGGGVVDETSGATFDQQRVLRRLRDIPGGAGACAIDEALSAGFAQLAKARQARRHLILISDFQRSEWDAVSADSISALRSGATADSPVVEVTFLPIPAARVDNISIQIDRPLGPSVVTPAQSLEVRVAVRNHGRDRIKGLPVVLAADGVSLASKNVEIAGDSQVFLVFACQLQTLGSHVLTVTANERAADSLSVVPSATTPTGASTKALVTGDDASRWCVEVIEPVRVGIVSARPPASKSIDDATFLSLALAPYAVSLEAAAVSEETAGWAEAHAGADPTGCEIVAPQAVDDRWLAQQRVVALMNIPRLDDATADRLERFVQNGGQLIIWAGDALDAKWYNDHWGAGSRQPLLPADWLEISRASGRPQASLKIQNQSYDHSALAFFNRSSNGRLDSIDFFTWYRVVVDRQAAEDATSGAPQRHAPSTLLSLDNGDPILLERRVGRGLVLQWTIQAADRWSNLPLREVFVPLMQQLVLHGATASMPQLNIETGAPIAIALDETANARQEIELLTPRNLRYRLDSQVQDGGKSVRFTATHFPGTYRLSGVRERPMAIAVNARPEESVLTTLDEGALGDWAKKIEAQIHPSADAFWDAEMVKQTGREIWRPLLAALVFFLFAELLLQQSLTRTPT